MRDRARAARASPAPPTSSTSCPQGYDTVVGARGAKLSGGQRQRIAIARAVLQGRADPAARRGDLGARRRDPSARCRRRSRSSKRDRTTLVVAHRLSTIVDADIICVVDRGRIVEQGRHGELLARNGLYARLYAAQAEFRRDAGMTSALRRPRPARAPALGLWLAGRARQGKEDPARLGERRGAASLPRPPGRLLWIHGAIAGRGAFRAAAAGAHPRRPSPARRHW
jgi:hypothetical protein